MNIFNHIKTTIIGLFFIVVAFYFEWNNSKMFLFIAIGILLLFAEDKVPEVMIKITDSLTKIIDKFFGK